jgi:hypothetical protein
VKTNNRPDAGRADKNGTLLEEYTSSTLAFVAAKVAGASVLDSGSKLELLTRPKGRIGLTTVHGMV